MTRAIGAAVAARLPLPRIALVWAAVSALLLVTGAANILAGQFPDPDDILRMVQLRDLLAGQGWFDITQYRIDPPGGVPMHWSRLVDVPLALVALALQPMFGAGTAQMAAAVIVPLLTLGCLLLVCGWIASRRFDDEIVGFACLCCALVPATLGKFQPLRIDHHGWQIVAVMLASAALFAARPARGYAVAGLALAAGLSISLEVLPFTAAFAGMLALRWLIDPARSAHLATFMAALAGGLLVLFAATRGPGALSPWCDAIAPAHLAFFAVVAAVTWLLSRVAAPPRWALAGGLAIAGALGLTAYAAIAPACLTTPFGALDPLVRHYWYDNVAEGLPVWRQIPSELAGALPLLAAAAALATLWRHATGEAREQWGNYLLLFVAACASGLLVWRSIAFAGALGAVPLGWLLSRLLQRLREWRARGTSRSAYLAMAVLAVALAGAVPLLTPAATARKSAPGETPSVGRSSCELRRYAPRLDRMAPATIFAPLDIGPSLIERSHHATVATSHHRAQAAMHDVITAFMADEKGARAIVAAHGATLMVVCTDLAEPQIYAAEAPQGLMAQILAGKAPGWLEPVDIGAPAALRVWRVRS